MNFSPASASSANFFLATRLMLSEMRALLLSKTWTSSTKCYRVRHRFKQTVFTCWLMSTSVTLWPVEAATWAMPAPMRPPPITTTCGCQRMEDMTRNTSTRGSTEAPLWWLHLQLERWPDLSWQSCSQRPSLFCKVDKRFQSFSGLTICQVKPFSLCENILFVSDSDSYLWDSALLTADPLLSVVTGSHAGSQLFQFGVDTPGGGYTGCTTIPGGPPCTMHQ